MKNSVLCFISFMILSSTLLFAQDKSASWQEMKNFHVVMAATFHPAEEGNFKPLRMKADSLLMSAKLWQVSPIPANYKPVETKEALLQLVKQSASIKKAVDDKASDAELKKMITDAHEIFHKIIGECKMAE